MKTKERTKQNAEVFTPPALVEEMLEKLPQETWEAGKTFLDNSCGDGNFLVAVLTRKLLEGHDPINALETIYGTDIMRDNIQECRLRLLKTIQLFDVVVTEAHCRTVLRNVKWLNTKKYPQGSLDYDFAFTDEIKREQVVSLLTLINPRKAVTRDRPYTPVPATVHQPACVA